MRSDEALTNSLSILL